ncbi:MAG TPA: hydrogenase maturation protease [Sedimentisphaerales bacterium]|nr:hydrogenase maturation protease [Sedimentisphaerales bacterium]
MKKEVVVLGLGNRLMADEGIGSWVVERLKTLSDKYPQAEFIDAGTGGMAVLHHISGRRKAVIIDCARMRTQPGTIKKFTPADVKSVKKLAPCCLHEVDVLRIIDLCEQLGQCPEEIVIFGIEPAGTVPGLKSSDILNSRMNDYVAAVVGELGV